MLMAKYPQLQWVWGPHPSRNCPISSNTGSNSSQTQQAMDKPPFRHSDAKSDQSGVHDDSDRRHYKDKDERSGKEWRRGASRMERGALAYILSSGISNLRIGHWARVISWRGSSEDIAMTITRLIT